MAAHHHHHPCHRPTTTAATNPISCHCHCYCQPHHHPPPPPEPHLHDPPYQSPHLYSHHPPSLPQRHERFQEHCFEDGGQTYPTVSSLLRRIDALESALRRRSSPSRSLRDAAARTIQAHFRAFLLHRSITLRQLKEFASIKSAFGVLKSSVSENTHFDYGAVYRKAANLLKKLNAIQGGDPLIRNGKISLSRELNEFLDFIDGVCMQRRRGISAGVRVRVRYREDNVKSRVPNSEREMGNAKSMGLKRAQAEKLRRLVERIDKLAEELDEEEQDEIIEKPNNDFMIRKHANRSGGLVKQNGRVQPKVKKNVSFAENGKVYRVLRRQHGPILEEYCDDSIDMENSVDAERELEDDLCREIEENKVFLNEDDDDDDDDGEEEEEIHLENGSSLLNNDGQKDSHSQSISEGSSSERKGHEQDETDEFVFCAPLPVKMETRGDSMRKKFGDI